MGSFGKNPCSLERNGIPFYQEGTVAVRLRRLILLFFAYGSTKPEKIAYGSSFGKSPPTPRGKRRDVRLNFSPELDL